MSELTIQLGSILAGAALMLALLGLGVAVIMPGIDRWSQRFFIVFFAILLLYTGCGLTEVIIGIPPDVRPTLNIIYYFESLLASILMPLMTVYLLHSCGENWEHSPLFRAISVIWILFFIIVSISPFTTLFYDISPEAQFIRGPLYPLIILPLEAIQLLNLAVVVHFRNRLSRRYFYSFIVGLLPIALVLFLHFFVTIFEFMGISVGICSLSMFVIILYDQVGQYLRQQREISNQNASIMILQMRPHFIYNTMMSIYYLCKQDPDLAQQVTLDFTTYLRKNFTAIASEELISFSEELEHTRAYLAVEQAQFEDILFVDYDTPHIDFDVPPLTLQPIVENAVKHGMDPDSDPLHILIRTSKTDSGSEIIVETSGMDYKPSDDNEPHIALKNIQQRLEMMCHGKMAIAAREGGGTVVKVTIPRSVQNHP